MSIIPGHTFGRSLLPQFVFLRDHGSECIIGMSHWVLSRWRMRNNDKSAVCALSTPSVAYADLSCFCMDSGKSILAYLQYALIGRLLVYRRTDFFRYFLALPWLSCSVSEAGRRGGGGIESNRARRPNRSGFMWFSSNFEKSCVNTG